jgi:hypothetical protein
MTYNIPQLRAVLADVESATGPDRELDYRLFTLTGGKPPARYGNPEWEYLGGGRFRCGLKRYDEESVSHDVWECPRLSSSIDAAVSLIERMLPGQGTFWRAITDYEALYEGGVIQRPAMETGGVTYDTQGMRPIYINAQAVNVPLALCAALLRALIAIDESRASDADNAGDGE